MRAATFTSRLILVAPLGLFLGCSGDTGGTTPSEVGGNSNVTSGGSVSTGGAISTGGIATGGTIASATGGTIASATGGTIASATGGTIATATGGTKGSATGGTKGSATGGTIAGATGGTKGSATGGTTANATGGTKAAGGSNATGGSNPVGGSNPAGGSKAVGGSSAAGGTSGSNGGTSTGGASTGGAGGTSSAKSAGCGIASPLKTGNFTESIDGTTRKWMLDVPSNYDGTKPYRLIFVWHPLSGSGSQIVSGGFNGLKSLSSSTAIFATADGLNGSNSEASGTGWWNANGGDMKLVQAMLDKINAGLCVDQERIFTTGFSFGGMMSYTLPFVFDVFRATAPCSGKEGVIPYTAKYNRAIPIMGFHGNNDTFVLTSLGKAFFDKYRTTRNHCGDQTTAVDPSPCVQYQGCDVPTTWCLFSGAHEAWSQEPQAIWKFFAQF
jgi:polyhydroxybutyrate depolymerase